MNFDATAQVLIDVVGEDATISSAFSVEAAAFRAHKSDYIEASPRPLS
ncbi:hypothetical protein IEU95_10500 [Hoyosella rhizosphaerae]|uniref:Uncharacterized protein n=1 Tax=Hoyosella rhizosphaerae TaxID=1755582 RepID=A0A916X8R4_9ACTN|nr:hypothetical protein [Hoyosella rhizosphaerae]MBN4927264.1 hypothetical protein [Hoyosella rhizosphaerae]GGC52642.1 hypothetical protein GCM10011410_01220 [Hoyosella rhizosphaerae]